MGDSLEVLSWLLGPIPQVEGQWLHLGTHQCQQSGRADLSLCKRCHETPGQREMHWSTKGTFWMAPNTSQMSNITHRTLWHSHNSTLIFPSIQSIEGYRLWSQCQSRGLKTGNFKCFFHQNSPNGCEGWMKTFSRSLLKAIPWIKNDWTTNCEIQ